jgi:anti-anti-sigma regulatory factor
MYLPSPEFLILDCSTLNYIDYMGVCALARIHADLLGVRVGMLFAQVQRKCAFDN